jgi:D-lactate dehydrogenase
MRTIIFHTRDFERPFIEKANNESGNELVFVEPGLSVETAALAKGFEVVCAFANDELNETVLRTLKSNGTRYIALRCAGFNQIDLRVADELGFVVARVPAYSPESIAEHTLALILTLNRKTHRAYNRVREGNLSLHGLMGFTLHGKTVGVIGTGRIGSAFIRILSGFGCSILASDPCPSELCTAMGARYVELNDVLEHADIISLNCPLTPQTHHLINEQSIHLMRPGVMLINTSRGSVVDTSALIDGLKSGKIGSVGLDVYEEEADLFYQDFSETMIKDDVFARLITFPNVLITAHQAFFTQEALASIASTTLLNINSFASNTVPLENIVTTELLA